MKREQSWKGEKLSVATRIGGSLLLTHGKTIVAENAIRFEV